jgi:hypothetical protein
MGALRALKCKPCSSRRQPLSATCHVSFVLEHESGRRRGTRVAPDPCHAPGPVLPPGAAPRCLRTIHMDDRANFPVPGCLSIWRVAHDHHSHRGRVRTSLSQQFLPMLNCVHIGSPRSLFLCGHPVPSCSSCSSHSVSAPCGSSASSAASGPPPTPSTS